MGILIQAEMEGRIDELLGSPEEEESAVRDYSDSEKTLGMLIQGLEERRIDEVLGQPEK